ncbi:Fic family protein, partial [Parafrankia sp. EUN1f]
KGGHPFCRPLFIEAELAKLFLKLKNDHYLIGLKREYFVAQLAVLYGEVNALHPFREGNGRAQRAFLRQLGAAAGWTVNWPALDKESNDGACHRYRIEYEPDELVKLLDPIVSPRPSW